MPFDWSNLLTYAEEIRNKQSPTESEIRSAISRAYYSVHNLASSATSPSGKVEKNNCHSDLVIRYKSDRYNTNNQEAGKILSGLKKDRLVADYNSDTSKLGTDLTKKLESVILQAKEFRRLTGL